MIVERKNIVLHFPIFASADVTESFDDISLLLLIKSL